MSKKKNKKNKCSISKAKKAARGIKRYKCICHHCSKDDHQRRNYKEYLASVKGKKLIKVYIVNMFMIKNYLSTLNSSSWVLNTKYGFNCNNMHELKKSRRLNIGKVDL